MRFDKLTQDIAAGAVWRLGMAANDLQIVTSSAPLSVTLYKGGAVIGQGSRVLAGDFFRGLDFDLVELASDVAQGVTILLSDGTSGSNRVVGEVSVVNGEIARVLDGLSFYGYAGVSGQAGLYSNCQLWNPAGSGKNLVVTKLRVSSSLQMLVYLGWNSVQLSASAGSDPVPKHLGAAHVSAALSRTERTAALIVMESFGMVEVTAGGQALFEFDEPVVIPPGVGFVAGSYDAASTITMSTDFYEADA